MYIILPIGIFVAAVAGIGYLVSRKFVYLKKLTPEAISDPPATMRTFWSGMFPEIVSFFGNINWREYRVKITAEFEKMVRKLRLVFLKIESLTHNLSLKLRRSKEKHEEILAKQEEAKAEEEAAAPVVTVVDPKEEEQRLIMEVAKNPKDYLLYVRLGDIYLKTGDQDNARASFETVLQLDPENWYAKKKLADLARLDEPR